MNGRAQTRAAKFNRKENLFARSVVQLTSNEERERGELVGVKEGVDGEEMSGVAGAETVRESRKGIAMFKENELYLSVVDGGKDIEDFGDFPHSIADDVAGKGDIADRCPQKAVARRGGARDETAERVFRVDFCREGFTAPDERFSRVERETDGLPFLLKQVESLLQVGAIADDGSIVMEPGM